MLKQKTRSKTRSKRSKRSKLKRRRSKLPLILGGLVLGGLSAYLYNNTSEKYTGKDIASIVGEDDVVTEVKNSITNNCKANLESLRLIRELDNKQTKGCLIICALHTGYGFRTWDRAVGVNPQSNWKNEPIRLGKLAKGEGFNREFAFAELVNRPVIVVYVSRDGNFDGYEDSREALIRGLEENNIRPPILHVKFSQKEYPEIGFSPIDLKDICNVIKKYSTKKNNSSRLDLFLFKNQ